jgi:hypothetical protein
MPKTGVCGILILVLALVFLCSPVCWARDGLEDEPVIGDLLLAKPVGFAALVVGTVTYVVTLPVTLPFGWHGKSAEALVKKPYRFTFKRPLGEDLDGP